MPKTRSTPRAVITLIVSAVNELASHFLITEFSIRKHLDGSLLPINLSDGITPRELMLWFKEGAFGTTNAGIQEGSLVIKDGISVLTKVRVIAIPPVGNAPETVLVSFPIDD